MIKEKKLLHIQDVKDPRGNTHSVLIYKNELTFGNLSFKSMKDVKNFIKTNYKVNVRLDKEYSKHYKDAVNNPIEELVMRRNGSRKVLGKFSN